MRGVLDLLLRPRVLVTLVVGILVVASVVLVRDGGTTRTVTAEFSRAVAVYPDTDVRILGVTVGRVIEVIPSGDRVRVRMEYDAEHPLPADARAVVITPTLVADRFVQLTPAYTGGDVLADGAVISLPDTGVPIELDRIYTSLRDLSRALGPDGANADGTLGNLLSVGAENLDGRGGEINEMLVELADAAQTFGAGSGDLFSTVRQLAEFTGTLAENDALVQAFLADLAGMSAVLAEERGELEAALAEVARSVGVVEEFVGENREALVTDVEKLTRVVETVASEQESLAKALRSGPLGLSNLHLAFDARSGTIGSRIGVEGNLADLDGFLCAVVQQTELTRVLRDVACGLFEGLLEPALAGEVQQGARVGPAADASRTQQRFADPGRPSLGGLMGAGGVG